MDIAARRSSASCELVAEVARSSGEVQLKLTGTSMVPAVWPGDVVTVRHCNVSQLKPGHIVLYCGESSLTAHRLLRFSNDLLILQGDSLPSCDPPMQAFGVVGRVVSIVRNGRPVSLKRKFRHRLVSSIVRRSELCRHVTLRLGSGPWHS
jgi:signal peptidase I